MATRLLRHMVRPARADGASNIVVPEVSVDLDDITTILIASNGGSKRASFVRSLLDRWPSAMVYWFEASNAETRTLRRLFGDATNALIINNRVGGEDDVETGTVSVDGLRLTTLDVLAIFTDDHADVIEGATDTLSRFSPWILGDARKVDDVVAMVRRTDAVVSVVDTDADASLFIAGAVRRREDCRRSSSGRCSPDPALPATSSPFPAHR